jgi:WD40 repeat protein
MPTPTACPPAERWRQHLAGTLAAAEQAELLAHLGTCPACRDRLPALVATNARLELARQADTSETPAAPRGRPAAPDRTSAVQAELPFLRPSARRGHLGRLGHYEITDVVGRGGMGIVFRAIDENLQRVVAIKVMPPELAASSLARQRFRREAQAAAAVSHDHVVTIHAVEEGDGVPYLVMQYIAGVSLQDRLRRGPLEIREVLRIGAQTALGLAAANAQGLVHRDIKPANILLENGVERVKITDFGLARAAEDVSLTQSGAVAGTPLYMSPEQANSAPLDARSDLFSLGTVLYEMCTGTPPFRGQSGPAVLRAVSDDTPRPVRELNPAVPKRLAEVITRLHAKDPARRYQSAAEVATVLGELLSEEQQASGVVRARSPRPERRRWVAAGLAVGVLLMGGVAAAVFLGRGGDDTTSTAGLPGGGDTANDPTPGKDPAVVRRPAGPFAFHEGPVAEVRVFNGHTRPVWDLALTPDGDHAVSVGADTTARVWDVATGRQVGRFTGHSTLLRAVAISPDSKRVLTGGGVGLTDGASPDANDLRLWDLKTAQELGRLKGHEAVVLSVTFAPDGKRALSGDRLGQIRLWDVEKCEQIGDPLLLHSGPVLSIRFSPRDPDLVLSCGADHKAKLWSLRQPAAPRVVVEHQGWAVSGVFLPDGRRILTGGSDRMMRLWEVADGKLVREFRHPTSLASVAVSPDGKLALSTSGQVPRLGDLLPAGYDENVRLWDLETGRELYCFSGHESFPTRALFTADGYALSAGGDYTLRKWCLPQGGKGSAPRRPGRFAWLHDATETEFLVWYLALDRRGSRLVFAHAHEREGTLRYCGIGLKDPGIASWQVDRAVPDKLLRERIASFLAQRFRIVHIASYCTLGALTHDVIYLRDGRPPLMVGTVAEPHVVGLAPGDFARVEQTMRRERLRPRSLSGCGDGKDGLLTLLPARDSGTPWRAFPALTEAEYEAKLREVRQDDGPLAGYRPLSVSAYATKAGLRFTLVLVKDDITEWAEGHDLKPGPDGFAKEAAAWEQKGYRPLVIVGYPVAAERGTESRYLGLWVKDELARPLGPPGVP